MITYLSYIRQSHRVMFTSRVWSLVLLCTLCIQPLHAANPIMPGADPHALVLGDTVWIYPTWSPGRGERFFAFSSTDLRNWQRHGPVLDFKDVAWIKDDGQERASRLGAGRAGPRGEVLFLLLRRPAGSDAFPHRRRGRRRAARAFSRLRQAAAHRRQWLRGDRPDGVRGPEIGNDLLVRGRQRRGEAPRLRVESGPGEPRA